MVARPVGTPERLAKWARRRPAVAGLLAALVLLTATGFGLVFWQGGRAETKADAEADAKELAEKRERQEQDARREVERLSASVMVDQGTSFCERGDVARGLVSFARALELAASAGDEDLERVARVNLASWPRQLIRPRGQFRHSKIVLAVRHS